MKVVQFCDGTYGVRKRWFFGWHFVDLSNLTFAWRPGQTFFSECKGTKERAIEVLATTSGHHMVVE